jgi:hypothetical protein
MRTLAAAAAAAPVINEALRSVDQTLLQMLHNPRPPAEPLHD